MTCNIPNNIKLQFVTLLLHRKSVSVKIIPILISILFAVASPIELSAQTDSIFTPLQIEFLKEMDSISEGSVYFNVLKLKNNTSSPIKGNVRFSVPQDWQIIASQSNAFSLNAGEEIHIPLRLSTPSSVVGDISYLISGIIETNGEFFSSNCYVFVRPQSKWRMEIDKNKLYLNEFANSEQFKLKISNQGNLLELIKLKFTIGNLYSISELSGVDSVLYIRVNPYSDTTFSYTVTEKKNISYTEIQTSKNNWKASTINIEASTVNDYMSTNLKVNQLISCKKELKKTTISPLNMRIMMYNLMASQSIKMQSQLYGTVLLPSNRSIYYDFNFNNLYLSPEKNADFNINDNLRFNAGFKSKNITLDIGDNIGNGNLHSISGRGVKLDVKAKKNNFRTTVVQNPVSYNRGLGFMYSRNLGFLSTGIGVAYSDNPKNQDFSAQSITPHIGFRFLRNNHVSVSMALSNVDFKNIEYAIPDTSVTGFSYSLNYRYIDKRLKIQFSNLNSKYNYLRNGGRNRTRLNSTYRIKNNMNLIGFYERYNYNATQYPYNFAYPANININEHGKLVCAYSHGKTVYQIGPKYESATREYYDMYSGFNTRYFNYSLGLYSTLTYRITNKSSISPNVSINNLNFDFTTTDTLFNNTSIDNQWYYTVGMNYYDYVWRLNIYYTSGSTSDLYRNVLTDEDPEVSQALHFRPYYERLFLQNTFKLSSYINYSYYMPSGRESLTFNLTADYTMKKYWQAYLSFNLFSNARIDDDYGRITSRNINTTVGIRKAFNIQQPRLKFHDIIVTCFNDVNGNGIRDAQEKPVSNILIAITRHASDSLRDKVYFPQTELLTDREGQICYDNMPEGNYTLELSPLDNLGNIFFLEGKKQIIKVDTKGEIYIPLIESFRVIGQIHIERDPNSTEGRISLEGIKITAVSEDGYTYSTITDPHGNYILNLQDDKQYTLTMSNVFNENFVIEQPEYSLRFGGSKSLKIDFRVHEKKRDVQFDNGKKYFDFNLNGN